MSYFVPSGNSPRRLAYLSEDLTNGNSYGNGIVSNQVISLGFPFDSFIGNMDWDLSNNYVTIPVKGLYLVSYGYNLRNNDSGTSNALIYVGITYATSSTSKTYRQIISAEESGSGLRYQISGTFFIFCEENSSIRGYIFRDTAQTLIAGQGATYLSVNLICASRT